MSGPTGTISPVPIMTCAVESVAVADGSGVEVGKEVGVDVNVGAVVPSSVAVGLAVFVPVGSAVAGISVLFIPAIRLPLGAVGCGTNRKPIKKRLAISAPMPSPKLRYLMSDGRMACILSLVS